MRSKCSVYLSGYSPEYADMFVRAGMYIVARLEDADFVQFIGGADVDPSFYNEKPHPSTYISTFADDRDKRTLKLARDLKKPCVGICRGGQFLNVMAGGKMYQHVNGHAKSNGHQATDVRTGESFIVSSTHHQMMIPGDGAVVLMTAAEASVREYMDGDSVVCMFRREEEPDYEALWYPKDKFLCYQPHPEFSSRNEKGDVTPAFPECRAHFFTLLEEFIIPVTAECC